MGLIFRDPLQQCFQKQVSKVSFRIVPALSQLLQNPKLKNYQSLLTSPAIPLLPSFIPYSTRIGTVSISPTNSLVYDTDWSDCGDHLLACLVDDDAVSIQYYTISPRGRRKSSANIVNTFQRRDPP